MYKNQILPNLACLLSFYPKRRPDDDKDVKKKKTGYGPKHHVNNATIFHQERKAPDPLLLETITHKKGNNTAARTVPPDWCFAGNLILKAGRLAAVRNGGREAQALVLGVELRVVVLQNL